MHEIDLEKCLTYQWPIHCICCDPNKQNDSSQTYLPEMMLMEHLFKRVCGKFREPEKTYLVLMD